MLSSLWYYTVLVVESVLGVVGIRLYEEPRFTIVDRLSNGVEIRRYDERLAAEATSKLDGEAGSSEAFRLLFRYIAGANVSASKIAMTTPVDVRSPQRIAMTTPVQLSNGGGTRMRFFLPATFTAATVPTPSDPGVSIVTVQSETIAVLRFSGNGADTPARAAELMDILTRSPWKSDGAPYFLGYDAPFTMPMFRRNEAAVRVIR